MIEKDGKPMFMGSTHVGERGQVVIPVEARRALDINPGDRLVVFLPPGHKGVVLVKVATMQAAIDAMMRTFMASLAEGEEESDEQTAK